MKKRRGVVLIAALMLLSLLALITAGGFAAAVAVRRVGRLAAAEATVMTDADGAMTSIVSNWSSLAPSALPLGQTATQVMTGVNATSTDTVSVTRLPSDLYWVVAAASTALPDRAHRRVNLLLRVPPLQPSPSSGLTSVGSVGIGGGVTFDQDTTRQGGMPCGQSTVSVVLAPGSTLFAESGGSIATIASGNQATAGDPTTYALAPEGWASFAARATVRYPPGVRATLVAAPILYGGGDLVIDGGSGRGLLLAEGRITIDGPTVFTGLIVARGGITINATTEVTGAVMSVASGSGAVSLQTAAIHYSACAVAAAVASATLPRPVRGRSWLEMF